MKEAGKIHIYTGDGKGKTSAAVGLCVRALGAGLKVLFVQFIKDGSSSEFKILRGQKAFTFKACGKGRFLRDGASADDRAGAEEGFKLACEALRSGEFDLLVLDEVFAALSCKLLDEAKLIEALKGRASGVEVALTGRAPSEALLELADLATEMRCVKHYYQKGRKALKGIEF